MMPLLRDVEFVPHPLYHVSPTEFDFPSRDEINLARPSRPTHANGVLGLWCSTFPNMCSSFGQHVYRVELKPGYRFLGVAIEEFQKLTSNMTDYADLIDFLSRETDVLYVADTSDGVGEVIVINFEAIAVFQNVSGQVLVDRKYRMTSETYCPTKNPFGRVRSPK